MVDGGRVVYRFRGAERLRRTDWGCGEMLWETGDDRHLEYKVCLSLSLGEGGTQG